MKLRPGSAICPQCGFRFYPTKPSQEVCDRCESVEEEEEEDEEEGE